MNQVSEQLPETLRVAVLAPFLIASVVLAAAYGSSFLLPDYLLAMKLAGITAGSVMSAGMAATIVCASTAGWFAQRYGVLQTASLAAFTMALAMLCLTAAPLATALAYLGGMLLGASWSVYFILAPLQLIHYLRPAARIKYLTLLSGSQMAGLGLAAPIGHLVAHLSGSFSAVYAGIAVCCVIATLCLDLTRRRMRNDPHMPVKSVVLTPTGALAIMRTRTGIPIVMIVFAACVFTGLSTYQSAYASSRGLRPETFFVTFTVVAVLLRFSIAAFVDKIPVARLALGLILLTLASLALYLVNAGSYGLYVGSTAAFALGYGLSYATLNAMAVNLAERMGLPVAVTSQVFTIAYFVGLLGFPYFAEMLVSQHGVDAMLYAMGLLMVLNVVLLGVMYPRALARPVTPH
ncbi:MAG: MFS transporter [Collimonas sp.]|uniref:MFS transporter n=1 Tax=Collimonas sp. TaxID=1963772 RepID=UPI003267AD11